MVPLSVTYTFSARIIPKIVKARRRFIHIAAGNIDVAISPRGAFTILSHGNVAEIGLAIRGRPSRPDPRLRIPDHPCPGQRPPEWDCAHYVAGSGVKAGAQ